MGRTLLVAFSTLVVASVLTLTGCASSSTLTAPNASGSAGRIMIVTSTNVYGDIAAQIGGDLVSVTSLIDNPNKDPHDYEADAQDQLALSKAQIVIENGGGYDAFIDTLLASANNPDAVVLDVSAISGYDQQPSEGQFNEHLWYDFPTIGKLVDELTANLSTIDAAHATTFQANADAFTKKLVALEVTESDLKALFSGQGVAITEPAPLYLLDAIGLVNKTPEAFTKAVQQGTDAPPLVLAETKALFSSGQAKLLVYNEQTGGSQTQAMLNAARAAGVAVVSVTETLPSGEDYLSWMTGTLDTLKTALAQ